ncbi:Six-hairpin glycosidase-like protein [Rhodofomes roseus]|uniref:Six-hairpin glycosidase-like protein n=1 Tax=Rhodofomes roseus TaxID=34475 RepID=A0ABQ8KXN7_9APHY|nr:Six-hairpin glycosidase-like protein [Rhodofomes roseus]KAH9844064.1 Six-hairpin glycosidase-like protein [Rhodofomes roseus]
MKFGLSSPAVTAVTLGAALSAAQCPDYTTYSQSPQGNPSTGPLALPYMRPDPACRTFNSTAVEDVIANMTSRLKDPDIARLFENTFPNTLDTTIKYFNETENLAFVITGDITAQWLRDTGNQLAQYHYLYTQDSELATLVKAIINNEARYVSQYPYCSAFQPPPESGLSTTVNDWAIDVLVNPPVDNQTVYECKYELDSLCSFMKLSRSYYQATNDSSFMNDNWLDAISQIMRVIWEQSQPTFDENWNLVSYYNWTGEAGSLPGAVNNGGNGEPKAYTGLIGTHHRPSDDLCTFAFLTPANAMLTVELGYLADILDSAGLASDVSQAAREYVTNITEAIWEHTLVNNVFAYETNGFGGRYVMDDANVPSLMSLPYLGFLNKSHPAYVATSQVLMSRVNPYYVVGKNFSGIGGPHEDAWNPWPMSLISAIYGTDDDDEILDYLYLIANNTDGLGLIHESIDIYDGSYTRPWFAWANSYFSEMLLDLASRKPYLIFNDNETYVPGQ